MKYLIIILIGMSLLSCEMPEKKQSVSEMIAEHEQEERKVVTDTLKAYTSDGVQTRWAIEARFETMPQVMMNITSSCRDYEYRDLPSKTLTQIFRAREGVFHIDYLGSPMDSIYEARNSCATKYLYEEMDSLYYEENQ